MDSGRVIGARDLILAIFRLAVADYLGLCYGHDEPAPVKRTKGTFHAEAEGFLRSSWAWYLGDLVGFQASAILRDAQWLYLRDQNGDRAA